MLLVQILTAVSPVNVITVSLAMEQTVQVGFGIMITITLCDLCELNSICLCLQFSKTSSFACSFVIFISFANMPSFLTKFVLERQ